MNCDAILQCVLNILWYPGSSTSNYLKFGLTRATIVNILSDLYSLYVLRVRIFFNWYYSQNMEYTQLFSIPGFNRVVQICSRLLSRLIFRIVAIAITMVFFINFIWFFYLNWYYAFFSSFYKFIEHFFGSIQFSFGGSRWISLIKNNYINVRWSFKWWRMCSLLSSRK